MDRKERRATERRIKKLKKKLSRLLITHKNKGIDNPNDELMDTYHELENLKGNVFVASTSGCFATISKSSVPKQLFENPQYDELKRLIVPLDVLLNGVNS
jgi:hypothetical protein